MSNRKDVDWEAEQATDWKNRRALNYPELSFDDVGVLYDVVSSILTALGEANIDVSVGANDEAKLAFRQLVKDRIPKVDV